MPIIAVLIKISAVTDHAELLSRFDVDLQSMCLITF